MGITRVVRGAAFFGAAAVIGVAGVQIAAASPGGSAATDRTGVSSVDSTTSKKKATKKRGPRGKRGFTGRAGPAGPRGPAGPAGAGVVAGGVAGGSMPQVGVVPSLAASYLPFGVSGAANPGYATALSALTISNFRLGVLGQVTTDRSWVLWKANGDLKTDVEYVACTIPAMVLANSSAVAACTAPTFSIAAGQVYGISYVAGPPTPSPTWSYTVS